MKTYVLVFFFLIIGTCNYAQDASMPENQEKTEQKLKVFPNPATSVVNILGLKNSSKAEIAIYDIYGNNVFIRKWEIRRNAINIPISSLEPGAYIITIHSDEQQVRTKFYKK